MLEPGTQLRFQKTEQGEWKEGTVVTCNKRGTVCKLSIGDDEDTSTINLQKGDYTVVKPINPTPRRTKPPADVATPADEEPNEATPVSAPRTLRNGKQRSRNPGTAKTPATVNKRVAKIDDGTRLETQVSDEDAVAKSGKPKNGKTPGVSGKAGAEKTNAGAGETPTSVANGVGITGKAGDANTPLAGKGDAGDGAGAGKTASAASSGAGSGGKRGKEKPPPARASNGAGKSGEAAVPSRRVLPRRGAAKEVSEELPGEELGDQPGEDIPVGHGHPAHVSGVGGVGNVSDDEGSDLDDDEAGGSEEGGESGEEDGERESVDEEGGESEEEEAELDGLTEPVREAAEKFDAAVPDPGALFAPSSDVAAAARGMLKALYDCGVGHVIDASRNPMLLPELHTEGFDAEQIWLQMEMGGGVLKRKTRKLVKKLPEDLRLVNPEMEEALQELLEPQSSSDDESDDGDDENDEDDDGGVSGDDDDDDDEDALGGKTLTPHHMAKRARPAVGEEDSGEGGESGEGEESGEDADVAAPRGAKRARVEKTGRGPRTIDAGSFKVKEMEEFLEDAEAAAERERDGDADVDEDDDDDEEEYEDDEDADLAALVNKAARAAGRKTAKRGAKRGRQNLFGENGDGEYEDDEDDDMDMDDEGGEDIMYDDFFGTGGNKGPRVAPGSTGRKGVDVRINGDVDEDGDGGMDEDGEGSDGEEKGGEEGEEGGEMDEPGEYDADGLLGEPVGEAAGDRTKDDSTAAMSRHERRLQQVAEQVRRLEAENFGEKDWHMRGEVRAAVRPLNSALEVDLDFERAIRPPPQPTEEATVALEDLIKQRIMDRNFDDPPRVVAAVLETKKTEFELNDQKSKKGLAEEYEEEFVRAATGTVAEDGDEPTRREARTLLKVLFAKLDALSHFHFTPKPLVEDMAVRVDVPALALEEIGPQAASAANVRVPEETFRAEAKGAPRADAELSHEEKRRRRAHKKQMRKKAGKSAKGKAGVPLAGRKSEREDREAALQSKSKKKAAAGNKAGPGGAASGKSDFRTSTAVFGRLQDAADAAARGEKPVPKKIAAMQGLSAAALKL